MRYVEEGCRSYKFFESEGVRHCYLQASLFSEARGASASFLGGDAVAGWRWGVDTGLLGCERIAGVDVWVNEYVFGPSRRSTDPNIRRQSIPNFASYATGAFARSMVESFGQRSVA